MGIVYNLDRQESPFSADNMIRHQEIRDALKARGLTISDVARQLGLSQATITTVSQGYSRSARVERHLAELLGTTCSTLFPERYPEEEA